MLRNIAVIGAGVSGLTAGYALKKIGLEVEIFERSQSIDAVSYTHLTLPTSLAG